MKTSHFAAKDPFKAQLGLASSRYGRRRSYPGDAASGAPVDRPLKVSTSAPTSGYIVVLRSLDTKSAGLRELRRAHANGFPSAELLFSSKYTTLRRGYWVVYVRYPTAKGATAGAARAHGTRLPVGLPAHRQAVTPATQVTPTPNR